ncbi:MAG: tetratricopeptide repeat protein [Planctomycetota bacterium]
MRSKCLCVAVMAWGCLVSVALAQSPEQEATQQYSAAVALQNQQLFDLAAEEWENFLDQYPDHKLSGKASYYLGVCRFQQRDYAQAERAFAHATQQRSKLRGSAFLNLGLAQFNQAQAKTSGSTEHLRRAIKTFETMGKELPAAPELEEALFYLGEAQYAVGERADAIASYRRALRKFPKHPRRIELLYGLGTAATEEGKDRTAKEAFSQLVSTTSSAASAAEKELLAEARIRLADLLLAEGSTSKAQRVLATASQADQGALADYAGLRLAESYFVSKKYAEAAGQFERVVKGFPQSEHVAKAMVGVAKSRFLAGDPQGTIRWLNAAGSEARQGTTAPEAAHWLARAYLKAGEAEQASATAKAALATLRSKQNQWQPVLQMDFADALFERGQAAQAAARYEQIADAHPDSDVAVEAAYMTTLVAMQREDHAKALQQAERFMKRFARGDAALTTEVRAMRAEALLQLGQYEDAARLWKQLIRDQPEEAQRTDWPLRLAVCHQENGDHRSVVRTLRSLQSSDQDVRAEAALLLAAALGELGDEQGAKQTLQRLLSGRPKKEHRARAQLLLVGLQRRTGDTEQALRTLARLKQDSPELVPVDVMLEQADLLFQRGDFTASAKSYEEAARAAKGGELLPDAMLGWGWSLLEAGDAEEAERVFGEVAQQSQFEDRHAEATYGRAVALYRTQRYEQASRLLKRFLRTRGGGTQQDRADATYLLGMCQDRMIRASVPERPDHQ